MEVKKIKPAFEDERGAITDLLVGEEIHHAGMLTLRTNAIRGRHYHKKSKQYTYVLSGKIELIFKDVRRVNAGRESVIMVPGDMVLIEPMMIHVLKALEESTILIFTSKARDGSSYEDDTYRVKDY